MTGGPLVCTAGKRLGKQRGAGKQPGCAPQQPRFEPSSRAAWQRPSERVKGQEQSRIPGEVEAGMKLADRRLPMAAGAGHCRPALPPLGLASPKAPHGLLHSPPAWLACSWAAAPHPRRELGRSGQPGRPPCCCARGGGGSAQLSKAIGRRRKLAPALRCARCCPACPCQARRRTYSNHLAFTRPHNAASGRTAAAAAVRASNETRQRGQGCSTHRAGRGRAGRKVFH